MVIYLDSFHFFQLVYLILLITASLKLTLMYSHLIRSFRYQLSVKLVLQLFVVFNNLLFSPINLSHLQVVFLDVSYSLRSINQGPHWSFFSREPHEVPTSPGAQGWEQRFSKSVGLQVPPPWPDLLTRRSVWDTRIIFFSENIFSLFSPASLCYN